MADHSVLRNGIAIRNFDFRPTPEAWWELAEAGVFGHRLPNNMVRNHDIACLLHIQGTGSRPHRETSRYASFSFRERFDRAEQDKTDLKKLAGQLLAEHFPGIRYNQPDRLRRVPSVKLRSSAYGVRQ
ncbi:DUF6047 family protein [Rikenella microfusus]|uniref:DUF6047 family protein n=1 Tax=Rikenella microfusus TaxID=28139 RepID=UPI003A9448ED